MGIHIHVGLASGSSNWAVFKKKADQEKISHRFCSKFFTSNSDVRGGGGGYPLHSPGFPSVSAAGLDGKKMRLLITEEGIAQTLHCTCHAGRGSISKLTAKKNPPTGTSFTTNSARPWLTLRRLNRSS